MNRRNFLRWLAAVPFLGFFVSKIEAKESPKLPDHFPSEILVYDPQGRSYKVPVAVVDDQTKLPHWFHREHLSSDGTKVTEISLPCITVSQDGMTIMVYSLYNSHAGQIYCLLASHYGNGTASLRYGRGCKFGPTIDDLWVADFDESKPHCVIKYRITLTYKGVK